MQQLTLESRGVTAANIGGCFKSLLSVSFPRRFHSYVANFTLVRPTEASKQYFLHSTDAVLTPCTQKAAGFAKPDANKKAGLHPGKVSFHLTSVNAAQVVG